MLVKCLYRVFVMQLYTLLIAFLLTRFALGSELAAAAVRGGFACIQCMSENVCVCVCAHVSLSLGSALSAAAFAVAGCACNYLQSQRRHEQQQQQQQHIGKSKLKTGFC